MTYFVVYANAQETVDELTDESAGKLLKALLHHANGDDLTLVGEERLVYKMMIQSIDENARKYAETCEKRRTAANARWDASAAGKMQMDANASKCIEADANALKDKDKVKVKDKVKDKDKQSIGKTKFSPPTIDEVRSYCSQKKYTFDPEQFVSYYTSVGWKIGGKAPMKDWHSACVTWQKRESEKRTGSGKKVTAQQYEQRDNDITEAFAQFTPQEIAEMMRDEC